VSATVEEILDLLDRYLEAREDERLMQSAFLDSLGPGRGTGLQVRDAGRHSTALLASRERTHTLYRALHLAARGVEAARYGREQVSVRRTSSEEEGGDK
jgi:hypothetical protein